MNSLASLAPMTTSLEGNALTSKVPFAGAEAKTDLAFSLKKYEINQLNHVSPSNDSILKSHYPSIWLKTRILSFTYQFFPIYHLLRINLFT